MTSTYVPFFSPYSALEDIIISEVGMSMTISDVVMSDGMRLEKVGVIPDIPIIPTARALAQKADPILAVATSLLGAPLTPEQAGQYNFLMEKEENEEKSDSDTSKHYSNALLQNTR